MFNFNPNRTSSFTAAKRARFFLFRFSNVFKNIFLFLLIVCLIFLGVSFLGLTSGYATTKNVVLIFTFFLIFWNLNLFSETKLKNSAAVLNLSDAAESPEKYNLAEFLNLEVAGIFNDCAAFCKKKKINISSTAFLHSVLKISKDVQLICFRLGIDNKKMQHDLKNYLEKMPKQSQSSEFFSDDFQKTIINALQNAEDRGHNFIGEKEILVGLAKNDGFLKKVLIDYDLKEIDVENMTAWLDSAEDVANENKKFWSYKNLARKGSLGKEWSSGYTVTLDKFSVDWTKVVSKWMFREIIGHQKEIEETEIILAKPESNSVLIVGNPGTGRKSIVEAIAQRCYLGASMPELKNKRIVELDPVLLAAQTPDFEKLESVLSQMFSEVMAAGNVILVVDDLENFVGQKMQKAGAFDISGILSKYLTMPGFQFIGITSYDGLHKNIEENSSFLDFFQKVEVQEISGPETIRILQSAALEAEYKHKILIIYPSIREIVNLTARYMPSLPHRQRLQYIQY